MFYGLIIIVKIVLSACTIYPLVKYIYNKLIDDIAKRVCERMKASSDK
jgi:hypothetical protein